MKTTIEIADPVLQQARRLAARRNTTLKALVEQGLRLVISDADDEQGAPFRLRKATFKGKGLQADAAGAGAARLIEIACEGRGG